MLFQEVFHNSHRPCWSLSRRGVTCSNGREAAGHREPTGPRPCLVGWGRPRGYPRRPPGKIRLAGAGRLTNAHWGRRSAPTYAPKSAGRRGPRLSATKQLRRPCPDQTRHGGGDDGIDDAANDFPHFLLVLRPLGPLPGSLPLLSLGSTQGFGVSRRAGPGSEEPA